MARIKMTKEKNIGPMKMGDEAPSLKDMLLVFLIILTLIVLSWIVYFKLGWLH